MYLRKWLIWTLTDWLTDRSSKPIGYLQSSQHHEILHAGRVWDTNKGKISKTQTFSFSTPKMKG